MGTVGARLHGTAVALRAVPRSSMIAAAKATKQLAADQGRRAGSPLTGKKRRGMTLRARDDIRAQGDTVTCRIQGVNVAGWVWVTSGTRPHQIRRRKRGPKSRMTVPHPGTVGHGHWTKVQDRAAKVVPEIFRDDVHRAVSGG